MSEPKSQLPPGVIKQLQEHIARKIQERGFEDENVHERLLLLAEEVGELINAVRHISGMNVDQNRKATNEVGEEIADVINMVFAVAIKLGIDVEDEFIKKDKKTDKRTYRRSLNNTK